MDTKKKPAADPKRRKTPKKITESYLHNAGLYYLQRFSASAAQFRRVMMRKVDKSCQAHEGQDRAACAALVDALVVTFVRSGLLNDEAFASAKVSSLRRQGKAKRSITAKLSAHGVAAELIDGALEKSLAETGIDDFHAAVRFARRRRLGPFGVVEKDRALAAFGRGGFSYEIAARVMAMDADAAEEVLRGF